VLALFNFIAFSIITSWWVKACNNHDFGVLLCRVCLAGIAALQVNIHRAYYYVVLVLQVLVPLLSNERNHDQWPQVVAHDVTRHVNSLKSNVYVVSGQAKGKTLLPLPVGAERVEEESEDDAE
jgi:hypothetical protein